MKRVKVITKTKKPGIKKTPKSLRDYLTSEELAKRDEVCCFRDPWAWVEVPNPHLADALALR